MKLFVGLGNPGDDHKNNRHNVGFMATSKISSIHNFGPWRKKFSSLLTEGVIGVDKVIILKPLTFMNLSGQAVGEAVRFYKVLSNDVTVFHDEIDLPSTKIKIKTGGGHAGHNGLRSIHQHIGSDYNRVRIGVGHPGNKNKVANYVLGNFSKLELNHLEEVFNMLAKNSTYIASGNLAELRSLMGSNQLDKSKLNITNKPKNIKKPVEAELSDNRSKLQKLIDKFI
jgi:PTH1 family peptidyl-tRNA hydrolase